MTYNVNNTNFIVPNLLPGVEYRIELRSICANGTVDPVYIAKNVITIVINDLVFPICPLPDSTVPVVGNLIPETILTSSSSSITLTWPSFSPGTNRQIFYIEVGKVNTEGFKEKFVIVRDEGSNTFYYRHIGGYDGWKSKRVQNIYVKILNIQNKSVSIYEPSLTQFTISKTSNIDQLKVKVDLSTSCNVNNPQPLIAINGEVAPTSQIFGFQEMESKSNQYEIIIDSDANDISTAILALKKIK